jgi:thiosulfate/3-mercaptopyruvate sulfurtransferase
VPYTTLVSPEVLSFHLDGSWVIVDCRYDLHNERWGREQYLDAHIPGAVYASLSHDLSAKATGANGRHPMLTAAAMADTFGRLGIGPADQVVAYDDITGMFASRLWWMLHYMGHEAAAVLDGGWSRWIKEGRPTRAGEEVRAAVTFSGSPRRHLQTNAEEIFARLHDPSFLLVDSRAPERFEGQVEPTDRAAGHIPGAVNRHYAANLSDEGTLLPAAVLRPRFEQLLGPHRPDHAVLYCGSGVSACQNLLAMAHAGLGGARLYPGSWSEWSSDPARPVETGPNPISDSRLSD